MAAHQAPLSLGFSRQEHWSGLPFPSPMQGSEKWKWSRSVLSNYYWPHGLQPTRCSCSWDLPGNSTGVGCHCLLCEGSLVFPFCCFPLFICIDHWRKLSYFSLQFFGTLHSSGCIFPFLLSFRFSFHSGGSDSKASVYNAGDPRSIPGFGRSPGKGNGNPLQYYCLENPMDRGAW